MSKAFDIRDEAIYDKQELAAKMKISVRSLERLIASHEAPASIKFGGKTVWTSSAFNTWVLSQNPHLVKAHSVAMAASQALKEFALRTSATKTDIQKSIPETLRDTLTEAEKVLLGAQQS